METDILSPGRIAELIFSCYPGTAGCVQQVLCTQNVSLQEKLRVVDAAVHMAFGCEVHDIVELVIREQLIGQTAVANITFYEVAAFVVDIFGR